MSTNHLNILKYTLLLPIRDFKRKGKYIDKFELDR